MNQRLIIAVALSFLIMLLWAQMMKKFYPVDRQDVALKGQSSDLAPVVTEPVLEPAIKEELITASTQNRELVFSLPSASLKMIKFLEFANDSFSLEQGFTLTNANLDFRPDKVNSQEAIFVHKDSTLKITKRFDYSDPNYAIKLDIKIENLSDHTIAYPINLLMATIDFTLQKTQSKRAGLQLKEVFLQSNNQIQRINPRQNDKQYSGEYFGFRNNYFCAILIPRIFAGSLKVIPSHCSKSLFGMNCAKSQLMLMQPTQNIFPNQSLHLEYWNYVGPQKSQSLQTFYKGAEKIVYYGKWDFFAKISLKILHFFFNIVHNWGLSIILFSIFISVCLFPLTWKQLHTTKATQRLQPTIEELRRQYKDNPQRLNKETMELYRKHKVNPFGGCLPMLLQVPIFLSFYLVLTRLLELKGANFLWINDLSLPDRLIKSPEINILPILMAITMFLQQKFSMPTVSGTGSEQQKLMTLLFPIMFGFIFYRMPSGLVLYWFTNSIIMFLFQMKIKGAYEPIKH